MSVTIALRGGLAISAVLVLACSVHQGGLGAGPEVDDGGGLIGSPFAGAGGTSGTGGVAGGAAGAGGASGVGGPTPAVDAAPSSTPDAGVVMTPVPPDAAVVPPPPDATVMPPPPDVAPPSPRDTAPPPPPDVAPQPPPRDAAPPRDAPSPPTVACGSISCLLTREICCVTAAGASCIPNNSVCVGAARRCDGPEDCQGGDRVCCARAETVGGYRSACTKLTECTLASGAPICRSGADCPASARTCSATNFSGTVIGLCR